MEFLDKVLEFLASVGPTAIIVLAGVVEFGLRYVKSEKALSIIYGVGWAFKKLGQIFTVLGELSDKVLPQKKAE